MATDVIMPALGVAQEKGTLLNWRKIEGQAVTKGEPLMEVETDKATVEIEAPASGILSNVTASAGDEIPVGNKIAVILAPAEVASGAGVQHPHPFPLPEGEGTREGTAVSEVGRIRTERLPGEEGTTAVRPETSTHSSPVTQPNPPVSPFVKGGSKGDFFASEISPLARTRILASPAAKRIAKEKGIDIASLQGSGPDGAVLAEDVLRAGSAQTTAPAGPLKVKQTVQLTPMRRIVGERMTKSKQTAPHFYLTMDADMTEIMRHRNLLKEKGESLIPSINDYILSACARALRDFPSLNAAFTDHGVEIYSDTNVGMAVALEEGLVVPVIRNADRLSLQELAKQSRELAEKAQTKKLFPLDYEGGTFTVSNLGMFGVDNFVAIINPPQCAILAVGQVAKRVVSHGEGIAVRPMMTMSLSADHRVVDGAIGARFLKEVKGCLERGEFR
jgi:pyruvate dehydrogenase E2 component (dihydrolipoamide acetyltransferase)